MNPDVNQNTAQPTATQRTVQPAANQNIPQPAATTGGFASSLKIAVPLVTLVGVVFGVTFIMFKAPPPDETNTSKEKNPSQTPQGEPPLRFFTMSRAWNPPLLRGEYRHFPLLAPSARPDVENFTLQDRIFQDIYEPSGDMKRSTQFWFENRNSDPVTLQLLDVSCSACTSGRVVALPPEVTRELFQFTAIGALPTGPINGFKLGLVQPAVSISRLKWDEQSFLNFREAPVAFKFPAAAANTDKWSAQWGILELQFRASGERKDPLTATFKVQKDGSPEFMTPTFAIKFNVTAACTVIPPSIDLGKVEIGTHEIKTGFLVVSPTRGPGSEFGDLEKPSYKIDVPTGSESFVEVLDKDTTRIPDEYLSEIEIKMQNRVRSAYQFTVAVRPKIGEKRMDIGRFERVISVTAGGATIPVRVTAMVRGSVWLSNDRTEIDLGSFSGGVGLKNHTDDLITENPDVELQIVKDQCKPVKKGLSYELQKQPNRGGQGHYKLLITIPSGMHGKFNGEVVLETKGPNPQRMRIPVNGSGSTR